MENSIVESKNRLESKENIAVRTKNSISNPKRENVGGGNTIARLKNKIVKAKKPNVINYKPLKIKLWHHEQNLQTQQHWNCTG
ncbi:MAG: hypothetical protein EOM76_04035 [Sphingobacteriia bacterium]|nr:hypothetical protein [Sphingobacteriia bacterium]